MSTKKTEPTTVRENLRASVLREMTVGYDQMFQPFPATITTGALAAGATAASATWGGDLGPFIPAAAGAGLGLMSWWTSAGMKAANRPHRVAKGIAISSTLWGGLASWAVATSPATWEPSGWLIAAAAGLIGLVGTRIGYGAVDALDEAHNRQIVAGTSAYQQAVYTKDWRPIVEEWQTRLTECGAKGVVIVDVNPLDKEDRAAGYVFFLSLTSDATALTEQLTTKLQTHARMDRGSSISFADGETFGDARMVVSMRPTAKVTTIAHDFSPLTINSDLPLVVDTTGKPLSVNLREENILVGGVPGAGKTTFLDGLLTSLMRCTDAVVFGCNLAKPEDFNSWTREDGTGILRLASTLPQLYAMLDAAEAIGEYRVSQRGGEKLQDVSPEWPQIVIVLDEFVKTMAMSARSDSKLDRGERYELAARVAELQSAYRSAGIRFVITATNLNNTAMEISDILTYSGVRLALTAKDRGQKALMKLAGGDFAGVPAGVTYTKGSGVFFTEDSVELCRTMLTVDPEPRETFNARDRAFPAQVLNAVAGYRPVIDAGSRAAAGALWDAMRAPGEPLNPADVVTYSDTDDDGGPALHVVKPQDSPEDFQARLQAAANGDLSGFAGPADDNGDRFKGMNLSALQG